MKRFSVMFLSATLAASVFATVNSANTFAQMSVTSDQEWTLLALPWVTPGNAADSNEIILTNLVLTTGLTAGDLLMRYTGSEYECWTINEGKWEPATLASETGIKQAPDPKTASFTRGIGVWLKRSDKTKPILLYGQVQNTNYGSVEVPADTTALIACPKATDLAVTSITGGGTDDLIEVYVDGGKKQFCYRIPTDGGDPTWCELTTKTETVKIMGQMLTKTTTSWTATDATIPAGIGFFYINKGSEAREIGWN